MRRVDHVEGRFNPQATDGIEDSGHAPVHQAGKAEKTADMQKTRSLLRKRRRIELRRRDEIQTATEIVAHSAAAARALPITALSSPLA